MSCCYISMKLQPDPSCPPKGGSARPLNKQSQAISPYRPAQHYWFQGLSAGAHSILASGKDVSIPTLVSPMTQIPSIFLPHLLASFWRQVLDHRGGVVSWVIVGHWTVHSICIQSMPQINSWIWVLKILLLIFLLCLPFHMTSCPEIVCSIFV